MYLIHTMFSHYTQLLYSTFKEGWITSQTVRMLYEGWFNLTNKWMDSYLI